MAGLAHLVWLLFVLTWCLLLPFVTAAGGIIEDICREHLNDPNHASGSPIIIGGDQIVDENFCRRIIDGTGGSRRKKRAVFNANNFPDQIWDSFPIAYIIQDSFADDEATNIRRALSHIEAQTCVRFSEVTTQAEADIQFTSADACLSSIGRSTLRPQEIFLTPNCIGRNGDVMHVVVQSLAFFHEHQRPDRDSYVKVFFENILDGENAGFIQYNENVIDTLGLPYDYASIMHFGGRQFTKNTSFNTLEATESRFQTTMGQRVELSFLDSKKINALYCRDEPRGCPASQLTCLGMGYLDPNNCSRCKCPDGFAGVTCEEYDLESESDCGGEIELDFFPVSIFSPGYRDPGPYYYTPRTSCTWVLKSKYNEAIEVQFESVFSLFSFDNICYHYVEIRNESDQQQNGQRFCGETRPDDVIRSETDTMMVLFRSNFSYGVSDEVLRGFKLVARLVNPSPCNYISCQNGGTCIDASGICDCLPEYKGTTCSTYVCGPTSSCVSGQSTCVVDSSTSRQYRCECFSGYTGTNCDIVDNPCNRIQCLNGGTCNRQTGTCTCRPGYKDSTCSTYVCGPTSSCVSGHGTCVVDPSTRRQYRCQCLPGYSGWNCNRDVCNPSPCRNRGRCVRSSSGYFCVCLPGFSGSRCQIASCGACGVTGPALRSACERTVEPVQYCQEVEYYYVTSWFRKIRRSRVVDRPCKEKFCCDNAELITMQNPHHNGVSDQYCAVEGYGPWCACRRACGACGITSRTRYYVEDDVGEDGEAIKVLKTAIEMKRCGFTPCRFRWDGALRCCRGYHVSDGLCVPDEDQS